MLYGVFSDVHSNLEALTAVLGFFSASGVKGYICCGDLVGYGPDPEPVLEKLQELSNLSIICGNHDLAVLGSLDLEWFNPYARAAALWTRDALSENSRAFLKGLTARLETSDFTVVHGSPRRPVDEYLMSPAQFKENISRVHVWPLFIGHSHMPLCFQALAEPVPQKTRRVGLEKEVGAEMFFLENGQEVAIARNPYGDTPTIFNPGSLGQPRDHDRRAACGLYDSEKKSFRCARVEYDIAAVQAKIRQAGLPEFLALRLAYGQ